MADNRQVIETWFNRVWNTPDESAIDDMLVPDTEAEGLGSQALIGPEGFKTFHRHFFDMMEDIEITVNKSLESGEWIAAHISMSAKKKGTGDPIKMTGQAFVKIKDGKLVQAYNHLDFMGLYQQLGLLPDDAFECCLRGEKVT